jgi:exosortase family protein XrtF
LYKFVKNFTLKRYFIQYQPFLLFLGKFFLSYILLTAMYRLYLARVDDNMLDGITINVAQLTQQLGNLFGIGIATQSDYMHYGIIYKDKIVARIIEGCNGISVIILFISFVIAFSGKWKQTVFFILGGSAILYILNIFRIILLSVLIYHFPNQEAILHGVVFPLIIYGIVFILWVIWVNNFSNYAAKYTQ